jgi:hypothetical protein
MCYTNIRQNAMREHVFVFNKNETQHLCQWKQKHLGLSQIGNNERNFFFIFKEDS